MGFLGSNVSFDRGRTWEPFDDGSFYTVDCVEASQACWAAGVNGRIAKLAVG